MSRTAEEWGRLAVSLPGWRWLHGMQTLPLPNPGLPDLDDPATLGCLLRLVRDAYGDARVHVRARANKWRCYSGVTPMGDWYDTEAAALVSALEAAP